MTITIVQFVLIYKFVPKCDDKNWHNNGESIEMSTSCGYLYANKFSEHMNKLESGNDTNMLKLFM